MNEKTVKKTNAKKTNAKKTNAKKTGRPCFKRMITTWRADGTDSGQGGKGI